MAHNQAFEAVKASSAGAEPFASLHDVPCHVEAILGTRMIRVRECLEMVPGTIFRTDQPAGSDMRLTINGVPVAMGEVVVVDEQTSVRVTEVLASSRGDLP